MGWRTWKATGEGWAVRGVRAQKEMLCGGILDERDLFLNFESPEAAQVFGPLDQHVQLLLHRVHDVHQRGLRFPLGCRFRPARSPSFCLLVFILQHSTAFKGVNDKEYIRIWQYRLPPLLHFTPANLASALLAGCFPLGKLFSITILLVNEIRMDHLAMMHYATQETYYA